MRKAKIVCTIGPASASPDVLDQLIARGMNVARLNFSHGSHESHARAIREVRDAAKRRGVAVAIIQDLQGPRIRVGNLSVEGIDVAQGQHVRLLAGTAPFDARRGIHYGAHSVGQSSITEVPVTYPRFAQDVKPGARILIDDGLIELRADRVTGEAVESTVVRGGRISANKGINVPGTLISEVSPTEKDREDIRFGVAQGLDYLALSFVRSPQDIVAARTLVAACGAEVPIIAKIERQEAIDCLEKLLDEADGVMVARGDLGVELGPEAVPLLQKRIIAEANHRRCLVITATQMLESMTQSQQPTRAEVSDVANAVFDGTDAVMLSAETSVGRYPVEALGVMDRIVRAAEGGMKPKGPKRKEDETEEGSVLEALCAAASVASSTIGASAIVAFSQSGATARLVSKRRPAAPIVGFTPSEQVRQRMALYHGVVPFTMPWISSVEERLREVERRLKDEKLAAAGDRIVVLAGSTLGQQPGTNSMELYQIR